MTIRAFGKVSIERMISMFQKGKRTAKRVIRIFFILLLFISQSEILVANEFEHEKGEKTENNSENNTKSLETFDSDEILFPYYMDMEELVEGVKEAMATSEEHFIFYVSSELTESEELIKLRKQLFPSVRSGNYYSATIFHIAFSISNLEGGRKDVKKLEIRVKRLDSKEEQMEVAKLVKEIANEIDKSAKNDYEKIKMTHDYLIEQIEYKKGYDGAYHALYSRKAVCNGYAATFQLIMEELGIPCKIVANNEINHMWNCVCLEGEWYHVDVTWDDALGEEERMDYRYFLKSKTEFYGHGELPDYTAKKPYSTDGFKVEKKNGWKQEGESIFYYIDDKVVIGWLLDEGKWYYFGEDGRFCYSLSSNSTTHHHFLCMPFLPCFRGVLRLFT